MSVSVIKPRQPEADRRVARGPEHPLRPWRLLLRDLVLGASREGDRVLVLTDSHGVISWVDGEPGPVERARALGLAPGTRWAGWADARGMDGACPATGPVWRCWAAPVFDPCSEERLGVLAVCGSAGSRDTLLLVRAVAQLAEEWVRRDLLHPPLHDQAVGADPDAVHLQVLGPGLPVAEVAGTRVALTPRRADILFLLARHADGLTADALAQELYGDAGNPLTVRVEVHRIRALLGSRLASAPYRFAVPVTSDADTVLRLAGSGRIEEAVLGYTGPLLPRSESLGIEQLRAELHQTVRAAALSAGGRALAIWCDRGAGQADTEALRRYVATLSPLDPATPCVQAHLAQLELEEAAVCNPRATSATGH